MLGVEVIRVDKPLHFDHLERERWRLQSEAVDFFRPALAMLPFKTSIDLPGQKEAEEAAIPLPSLEDFKACLL